MNYGYVNESDKRDFENLKREIKKIEGKNANKYFENMEKFRKLLLSNKREIVKKYLNMSFKEREEKRKQQPEVMKERIKILKQYPYLRKYFKEFEKYLNKEHGNNILCEMVVSDEFKVFTIETEDKRPIVVISGWYNNYNYKYYNHIKAFVIMPLFHKLTIREFIKIEQQTKATEVKVINEDETVIYEEFTKTVNVMGRSPGYSLAISKI